MVRQNICHVQLAPAWFVALCMHPPKVIAMIIPLTMGQAGRKPRNIYNRRNIRSVDI
jgi:hypothetical protein